MPFKGELSLLDTVALVTLFGLYTWATARAPAEEPTWSAPPSHRLDRHQDPPRSDTFAVSVRRM